VFEKETKEVHMGIIIMITIVLMFVYEKTDKQKYQIGF